MWEKLISNEPYIVAEAGVNHLGSIELGEALIKAAKESGVNAIKFQSYKAGKLCTKNAPRFWDWEGELKKEGSQFDSYSLLDSFGKNEHLELKKLCDKYQIDFVSTPFDTEAADYLDEIGMEIYKIASCDINNFYLLEHVAKKGKPILLSTGAANLDEIKEALAVIESTGNKQIVPLHCNLCYPTKDEEINLLMIKNLIEQFPQYPIGLSDHTMNLMTPAVAYVLGARVFERHFTIDKTLKKSADHWLSADPADLKEIIKNINTVRTLMGTHTEKQSTPSEERTRKYARRSVAADKDIKAGEVLTTENITCKRPGTGISAKHYKEFLGKKAKVDIPFDTLLTWEIVE
jgi:sialic acid synthase SpsE